MAGALPSFANYTEEELGCYRRLFASGEHGALDSEAVRLLQRSGLSHETLRDLWATADPEKSGQLDWRRFCAAMRLVAHAQQGHLEPGLLWRPPASLPRFQSEGQAVRSLDLSQEDKASPSSPGSPRFGLERAPAQRARASPERPPPPAVARQLSAMSVSDRALMQRLLQEAGGLEAKVQQARQEQKLVRAQADEARKVELHMSELQSQLERHLRENRAHLAVLAEERRRLTEIICGSVNQEQAAAKRRFLEQALEDEMRCLEETRDSNAVLEESCRGLQEELRSIQQERLTTRQEAEHELRLEGQVPAWDGSNRLTRVGV
ncbi:unnamed protein product [Effrenium voratum]|nr:unnamed protein product [Effrenium voratum]